MKITATKFAKKYFLSAFLILLLVWSVLNQTFLATDFDQAKTAVARWPQLAKSHLNFSLALFNSGSADYQKELTLAKKSFFWNEKKFSPQLKILEQPQTIREEIKQWQSWLDKGVESPEIYLRLSLLHYQLYEDEVSKEYWEKARYLDPNNKIFTSSLLF